MKTKIKQVESDGQIRRSGRLKNQKRVVLDEQPDLDTFEIQEVNEKL